MKYVLVILNFFVSFNLSAQVLPANRVVDWTVAGYRGVIPNYTTVVDITNFGALGDGLTPNDTAFLNAVNSLSGTEAVIYFPPGTYVFKKSMNLRSGLIIRGASADSTILHFDLTNYPSANAINIIGMTTPIIVNLTDNAYKDSLCISVSDTSSLRPNDYLKLTFNDSSLLFSSWAYGTVGQIIQIKEVPNLNPVLQRSLRRDYTLANNSKIRKLNMITGVGIECLKIERLDATPGQTSNIYYNYAAQCWISGIESANCNFAHIEINNSTNISIKGSYIHDAFAYGGGGQGYGVICQATTGECLIENNIFNHLRHSMLIQSGANGNVYAYNYSINPYWTEQFLPSNAAGDMVLHGNYPYANLFEGNIGQNIVIDDSHGINGPYNTFFRNRADLYGIFMNNNPASDNQNFIGNEITNTGFALGLYLLNGSGHFQYGNNVKGTIYASGTNDLTDTSYYSKNHPPYIGTFTHWPAIGLPNVISAGSIPAKDRFDNLDYTLCGEFMPTNTIISVSERLLHVFPNPSDGVFYVQTQEQIDIAVYNSMGCLLKKIKSVNTFTQLDLFGFSSGLYFLIPETSAGRGEPVKLILQ